MSVTCLYLAFLFIDVASVFDFDHGDDEFLLSDLIKNTIISLSQAIALLSREFLTVGREGVFGQALDGLQDSNLILFGNGLEVLLDGLFKFN